ILKEQGRSEQEIEEIRELAQQAHLEAWRFPDKVKRDAARKLKQYKLPLQLIADSFGLTLAGVKRL
ncbi:MAG: hypothetical protein LBS86_03065, partial [Treponema sp.]|nr:hypothetical protein [Treponema sp.]